MAKQHPGKTSKYLPISLHTLRVDTITNFDIYMKLSERNRDERFVLYRKRNITFTERTRNSLIEHGTDQLYIDVSDKAQYQRYLENNLETIVKDTTIPTDQKSAIAYTCATGLVEQLLENPRSGEHVKRSKAVISNLANYLLSEATAFFSLLATTSFDYYTYTHSVNVAVFGMALAHRLQQYTETQIKEIGAGLILHDIGKSLIEKRILNKRGALNKSEWAVMKEHPENGVRLLNSSGETNETVLMIVMDHHEKLDGSGYPRGLRGSAIHPYVRIAAIADIFDALTTRRPYKLAERSFPALKTMRDEMNKALDPDLFKEFVLLLGADSIASS
ncbi:MAG: HD domain-containing protein [Candidatus Abyssubacteria bacterium]